MYFRSSQSTSSQTIVNPVISPIPSSNSNSDLDQITQALALKMGTSASNLVVSVKSNTGDFASGNVGEKNAAGGELWIAAKTSSGWIIATAGNGIPLCSEVDPFKVPVALADTCTDAKDNVINRHDSSAVPPSRAGFYSSPKYKFTFSYPTDFKINSTSTPESISFLQKQNGSYAQRLLVNVITNPNNSSLSEVAKKVDPTFSEQMSTLGFQGPYQTLVEQDPDSANGCATKAQKVLVREVFFKGTNLVVEFIPNESCDTITQDWLDPILESFEFIK
jgi:hypothetical protein